MDYPDSQRDFNRRIERQIAHLEQLQSQHFSKYAALLGHRQNPRLARTVPDTSDVPTYPTQGISGGNTFPIHFLSGGFSDSFGLHTPQYTAHEAIGTPQARVHAVYNNYIPAQTIIQVWQDRGVDSSYPGEWWTDYIDPPRIGVTSAGIAKNANGNVLEYSPNNYSTEASASRTWLCRNWCGYDLLTNTRVFFQQLGGVAYILNAECDPE